MNDEEKQKLAQGIIDAAEELSSAAEYQEQCRAKLEGATRRHTTASRNHAKAVMALRDHVPATTEPSSNLKEPDRG